MINIKKTLDDAVKYRVTRWPTFTGRELERHKFVTSSEIARCARRIKFEKERGAQKHVQDQTPVFEKWGWAERGNAVEAWIVDTLIGVGVDLQYAGADQVSFYCDVQSGTPDGVSPYKQGLWVWEFKSYDPRKRVSDFPTPAHVDQLQQNMELVHICLDKPVYGGTIYYQNASNFQESHQFDFEPDHARQAKLQERAEWIVAAKSPADLPNEGIYTGDCDHCGFTAECSQMVAGTYAGLQNAGKGVFK